MTHRPMKRITGVEVLRPLDGTGRAEVRMFYGSHCVTLGLSGLPALLIPFSVTEVRIAARSAVTSTLLREIPIEMCRQYAVKAILGPMPDLEPINVEDLIRDTVVETLAEQARQAAEADKKRQEFDAEVRRRAEEKYMGDAFKHVTGFTGHGEA